MLLQFVDTQAVDPETRKRIRSHVMQGKNAGRKLNRGRRVAATPRPVLPITPSLDLPLQREAEIVSEVLSLIELVIYPVSFCQHAGDVRAQWMRVCIEDQGCMPPTHRLVSPNDL